MAKVAVIGAGIGGVPMAFELKEMLGKTSDVQVVSDSEWFQFVPSNPWVAVNWRTADQVRVHLPGTFAKLKIGFNASGAKRIDPANNVVYLGDGSRLDYDYLVIATGPKLAFDEIAGLGPQANTNSICDVGHAAQREREVGGLLPGPRSDGRRRGSGRILLRTRLRIRDAGSDRAAPAQDPGPRADDLPHAGALYRPPRLGRGGRYEEPARIRHARPRYQVDHQREDRPYRR